MCKRSLNVSVVFVEEKFLWKRTLCGSAACVVVKFLWKWGLGGSEFLWKRGLFETRVFVEVELAWKCSLCGSVVLYGSEVCVEVEFCLKKQFRVGHLKDLFNSDGSPLAVLTW